MNRLALLLGRALGAFFFLYGAFNHLTKTSTYAQYAAGAGVPLPKLAIIVTGLMLLAGGLSLLLGYQVRWGALLLVAFLIPVSFFMHRFWGLADPAMAQFQAANFWKNITIAGALLIVYWYAATYPGRWPYSVGGGSSPTA